MDLGVTADKIGLVDASVKTDIGEAKATLLSTSGLQWLRTVERHGEGILGRCKDGDDIPYGPDTSFIKIIEALLVKGYVPSDNYGTHESGYRPCLWWCRRSTEFIARKHAAPIRDDDDDDEDLNDRSVHATWFSLVCSYAYGFLPDPESDHYPAPAWHKGIPELDPGNVGYDDEYD
jgi:hypothetical protein